MDSEIKTIINDLGDYASNEKPQRNEHNVIIPFSLHYTDANLLFSYICELEDENKKLREELDDVNITKDNYVKLINRVGELEERINKAIEYIHNHQPVFRLCSKEQLQEWFEKEYYVELLKILENEEDYEEVK